MGNMYGIALARALDLLIVCLLGPLTRVPKLSLLQF